MEQELNYVRVKFKTDGSSAGGEPCDLETIYDEVKTYEEQAWDTNRASPDVKKAPLLTAIHLVASALGIMCVLLASAVIALSVYFSGAVSEQRRENLDLTARNLQLRANEANLEKEAEELTRERDGLNWTVGVILEYENFPVNKRCPHKVCRPCPQGWTTFQSNCYMFSTSSWSSWWLTWKGSRDECKRTRADLVVIESQEEQEFLNNHTESYHDDKHGYWTGLRNTDTWTWVDGSNLTVMDWKSNEANSNLCGLLQATEGPLANLGKASCDMKNRWICERRALIKTDRDPGP
ncbi:C-type lectin domain family 4 member M-like [Pungitius pungitius]|uniref:C-type lectin domain family 4 member M-like n=1 Tax=Pungitius pungitius TaxID=134920 RepID=UPI002E118BE8